jgi:hypothetical protein
MTTNHGNENHGYENDDTRNPGVEFDKSDLGARGILIFFVVLGMFAVAAHLGVLGMYMGMTKIAEKHDTELSPLAPKTVTPRSGILTNTADVNAQKFPEPRLQLDDTSDMTKFLAKETEALTAQPWQDAQGNVHLPIEQAMKTVASRLPVRAGGEAPANYPGAARQYGYPAAQGEGLQIENQSKQADPPEGK